MSYLQHNKDYWEKGYHAINVDRPAFLLQGRILRPQFALPHADGSSRLVDFGCGQGAVLNYFHMQGYNAVGVDISDADLAIGRARHPHIAGKFLRCEPHPDDNLFYGHESNVDVVTAIQALYYFTDTHLQACLEKIYVSMKPGGVFFATMMGEESKEFFNNSQPYEDGLRVVNFRNERLNVQDYYISFIKDEDHLKSKFSMFKPVHIGYYSTKIRQDEGDGFHFTFCGVK